MMLKVSLIASLLAFSVLGAPVLQGLEKDAAPIMKRSENDALVGYSNDKRSENDALVGYSNDKRNENDALVGYSNDKRSKNDVLVG